MGKIAKTIGSEMVTFGTKALQQQQQQQQQYSQQQVVVIGNEGKDDLKWNWNRLAYT
jgi:tRNA G18 (ribose-2'-O)-methylase SpoU